MKSSEMKSYLDLIPISAKARRKQNRLTLFCIVLAVFLVTTVFSMAEIMAKGEDRATVKKHGSHHILINGLSKEEAEQIAGRSDVSVSAWYCAFGEDIYEGYEIDNKRVILYGTEPSYISDIRKYEQEGVFPQNENEVMLNTTAKELLGIQIGDSVVIQTPAGEFAFAVTGFCLDEMAKYNRKYDGVCAYLSPAVLENILNANGVSCMPSYVVRFAQKAKLRKAITDVKMQYGLSDECVEENLITVAIAGASSNKNINALYPLAAAVFVMVLIAGVLMISSCMNSSVLQRTKFFGMMRCIGASKKQVMQFVRLEALNWCKTAIPVGLGLSLTVTWIMCIVLKELVGGEFSEFTFQFSIPGIVSGILVGVVSVLLAAHSPARHAANVSPVAAVSGSAETVKTVSYAANTRLFKVESALGVYHAVFSKKNITLMSLSFAFTVVLFLAFYAVLDFANRLLPVDGELNPDISIAALNNTNTVSRSMKDEMSKLPGVEAVFGSAMAFNIPVLINGNEGSVDLISYDAYMFQWTENAVASGSMKSIKGDTNNVLTIFNRDSRLNVGDKINLAGTELEIVCVVSSGVGTDRPALVCTEETFQRITGEGDYMSLNVRLAKDTSEETVDALRAIAGDNEFLDRREENELSAESRSSFGVFQMAAYGFLTIIALITIFNIMNSISMSVSARMRQYGAMRAVGMSVHQMTKMIAAEAVAYAVCGLIVGGVGGLFLHWIIMSKLVFEHFGGTWKIPVEPLVIVVIIFAFSCAAAVYAPAKRIREMEITETINEL